ncbi:hypothetical protein SynPROS91_02414 [Synechococcus sp. PROS-9-1]|uniref:hypothetical protein n=1 Tax=Synechococcus sp. PROS-9-1 TaxID=1968775 RepID=UPI001647CF85|nr:hypothetical protein [Synechococcus sp. PROS-9-1]QNJ32764.1 hypothetical protein SynPROS91_02414 [Synechococcus sp. PROS-9-1]
MDETLGRNYLLYLKDMSRKIIFGSRSSAGNYSSILILNTRRKDDSRFSRITNMTLEEIKGKGIEGYRLEMQQEKEGNAIFCAAGIIAGVVPSQLIKKDKDFLVAAPLIYGRLQFEEDGECEIDEWVLNYDLATELLNQFNETTSTLPLSLELGNGLRPLEVIRDLEETLEGTDPNCIDDINVASKKYSNFIASVLQMDLGYSPSPRVSANKATKLKDANQTGLFYVGGDWIFSAPVPAGLNTYTALQDISGLFKSQDS